ncbi:unnamed protein product [Phytophthora lilii]|uniref:Unnamed protein product n=1 Tax=Phytophthora lilii TaxID=2077276 RepID=A0A9W6WS30_9STRA|nr:unnamed protein product [Phytophthora lilii]
MLVGIVGTEDIGVLIQIRASSNKCVIKLNNGTLKKNVPLDDIEEAKDMSDTKEKRSPIRLGEAAESSPGKSPTKLASWSVDTRRTTDKLKTSSLEVGDSVRARCNGGSRWFPGKILRVNRDGTYDVEYSDGDVERKMAAADVEAATKLDKSPLGASPPRKKGDSLRFEVGDKVKARYKKGTKFFSGEIARVRSDSTYDIKYDDGDSETRVERDMIEPNSQAPTRKYDNDDDNLSSKPKKSSGFRVDQHIKVRYKGGKILFPGKIKRVHSDGTYDILYDDGDEEKRVKAESIEAVGEPRADSDEGHKSKAPTSRSNTFKVGRQVKVRYKKGKRLFRGRISRVRSDGTYDINYDDGEMETRVEASLIEVSDEDDMFADSDNDNTQSSSTKKKAMSWEVGDRIKAYYGKGKRLFPGKIAKVHMNGTYDILYDDGDSESRVDASLVEGVASEQRSKPRPKSSGNRPLQVGDAVKAKYKRGTKFFPGKITRERMDGTFDIRYDDGDVEECVEVDLIQRVDDVDKTDEGADTEKKSSKSFEVGDIVKAPFKRGTKLFRGKISRVRSDGTYDISFDDGDQDTHIPSNLIEPEKKLDAKPKLKVGDTVQARYKKGNKLFAAIITKVRSDGTYDVEYDDGDVEMGVEYEMIEVSESKMRGGGDRTESPKPAKTLKVGDKVRARYNKGSKLLNGEITAVHRDGTYDIRYDDGDKEKYVESKDIIAAEDEEESHSPAKSSNTLKVGDPIEANYKNGVKKFPGKISRVQSDGTYDIAYNDGDSERRVPRSRITSKKDDDSSPQKYVGFAVGDAIKAKYKKGTKYFPGKIVRVRSDGTYDIAYDDGDSESRVDAALIISAALETSKASEHSPKLSNKAKQFEVGDAIKARYKKGAKLFAGKITRVRSDGTYDVRYDDGDTEMHVEGSYIVGDEKPDTADEKKPGSFAVGDKVNARYKGGVKAFPGKIVKVRMDGTFDVKYDDGDMEVRMKSSAIELVPETKIKKLEAKASKDKDDIFGDSDSDEKNKKGSKKKAAINVGDVVEANFKQKGKFHRGKVVRVRSDGTFDIEYDVGASESRISVKDMKKINDNQETSDDNMKKQKKSKEKKLHHSTDSEQEEDKPSLKKLTKKSKLRSSSESSESGRESSVPLKKGDKVTYRKAGSSKSRRVGTVKKVHSDGSCDIKYGDGDILKRVARQLVVGCSDSEDSDDVSPHKASQNRQRTKEVIFRRHERVIASWQRSSKLSKPRMTDKWLNATVLERNSDDTYTVLRRLFDSDSLQTYKRLFKESDSKGSGKISRSKIIAIVEELMAVSNVTKIDRPNHSSNRSDDDNSSPNHILTEWFATHDDLRIHRHFGFMTLMLAFAYAKSRLGKLRMEQSVATVLEGRFASYHENKRQLELWQQKLGYRLFETLQRHFHDHALPNMIPSRIRVSELSLVFEQVARQAVPKKPLEVYLQQHQLFPHNTLLLPEFLCCYYQLYGSASIASGSWSGAVDLRPIAFVASCLFSNGDNVCKRHGDLVRRLSVGRTQAQQDLILHFRETFESLLSTELRSVESHQELLLDTSQLSAFAVKVAPDPSLLEPALTTLRKRSGAVSLVEVYGCCGFIIDELTSAPTIRNAIEKMRMRIDLAEVRRVIGLVRNICVKILRFPHNADYWRIRSDNSAFQQKIGRFDGATSLLEAVGFVEHHKTHFELRGARNSEGKRVSALEKTTLDSLRDKCIQLDGELSLFDGVESISSILQRISEERESKGSQFTLDECREVLKYLGLYIENVLKNPKDSRCWRIRETNKMFQRQIGYLPYAAELMESIGFELEQTSNGNAYTLRGTSMKDVSAKNANLSSASLSNFAFTTVSSQMEWFLWRRKQEIDSLLEDEMRYLHDIVGHFPKSHNLDDRDTAHKLPNGYAREDVVVKMYPYGTNAVETFNKTSIQRLQLEMMRDAFNKMDVDQKGFLIEADFSRTYGSPSTRPVWSRCDAFDIGKDGKVDFNDFVAALGPLLDHSYELTTDKSGERVASSVRDDANLSLCELVSLAVGKLRLETGCSVAAVTLEVLLTFFHCIVQEPGNNSFWIVDEKTTVGSKILRFPAARELLRLVGFRETTSASGASNPNRTVRQLELQPQRVRFKTSESLSEPTSLDTATISRCQTIAAMLCGHYRGLKTPSISDISAVSSAIADTEQLSGDWRQVVQLAMKCIRNIEAHPQSPRYRELNTATNIFMKVVGRVQGGLELLLSLGFRETDSGTLIIASDKPLNELAARRFELEVGLALLHLKANPEHGLPGAAVSKHHYKSVVQSLANSTSSSRQISDGAGSLAAQSITIKRGQDQRRERASQALPGSFAVASVQPYQAKTPVTKSSLARRRTRSARTVTDPIEREILLDFPPNEDVRRSKSSNRGQPASNVLSRKQRNGQALHNGKQRQRRVHNKSPPASSNTMLLAENAVPGNETIIVQKGQFVPRGTYVRIGAEITDLYEERMVVDVSSNGEHAPGLTRLRLGIPLRFFHPSKELVSTLLLPSTMELSKRLEMSDTQDDLKTLKFKSVSALATSFEDMTTLSVVSPNVRVGPSMRYVASWGGSFSSNGARDKPSKVLVVGDYLTERKIQAHWEGLVLQFGPSNKKVRIGDVKWIIRRNAYLSLLLSTATCENKKSMALRIKNDDFQITYEGFCDYFSLPPSIALPGLQNHEDEEDKLHLPLAYLKKHFQLLAQSTTSTVDGYKAVQTGQLLYRVYKDIQDHPPVVSEDPHDNQSGRDKVQAICLQLENGFIGTQQPEQISWPQLVYFVRYNKRLNTPEIFPSSGYELVLNDGKNIGTSCRDVAEIVLGMHGSRLVALYFDGSMEVWNLLGASATLESRSVVLFSTKNNALEPTAKKGKADEQQGLESKRHRSRKTFMQAWGDANQISPPSDTQGKRISAYILQFKRMTEASGALIRFCAWDSIVCVNASILEETGSGSLRFFRFGHHVLSPVRQIAIKHCKVECSVVRSSNSRSANTNGSSAQKWEYCASTGIIKTFEITDDGSKVVFQTGSDSILWVVCAGTGDVLCHANLQAAQVGRFRALFQVINSDLGYGGMPTLYATTSAKSYRHVGMWRLPLGTEVLQSFERTKIFSFGKTKVATAASIALFKDMLFVASRDGTVIIWSNAIDQCSPIQPLTCVQIPLQNQKLYSIFCQSLQPESREFRTSQIEVEDRAAAEIDRWEVEMLQAFSPSPLRFALYLFDDNEVVRLSIPGKFDIRLVTLDDPTFEFDVFLVPVSGVEQNKARRVTLQKHRIVRVLFIALHYSSSGVFAQKKVQEFFMDLEKYNIMWKARNEMNKFALSYQENVAVKLRTFYRRDDGEHVELTQSHFRKEYNLTSKSQENTPVLVIGAVVKSSGRDQMQFQAWKLTINWLENDMGIEVESWHQQYTKQTLARRSSYRLETERLLRVRKDFERQERLAYLEHRQNALVRCMIRNIIASSHHQEKAADNLLKAVNVLVLASFDAQVEIHPAEAYLKGLLNASLSKSKDDQSVEIPRIQTSFLVNLIQSQEDRCVCAGAWLKCISQAILVIEKTEVKTSFTWDQLSLIARQIEARTLTIADLGALFVNIGLTDSACLSDSIQICSSSSSLSGLILQLYHFLSSKEGNHDTSAIESKMDTLLSPHTVVEFIIECTSFTAFFKTKMIDLKTNAATLVRSMNEQAAPEATYALQRKVRRWQQELRQVAQIQNGMCTEVPVDERVGTAVPSAEDLQQLQRLLKAPLPYISPNLSSITLDDRCNTIRCCDRFVINAIGRVATGGVEFKSLSVLYVLIENGADVDERFQQERAFLKKLQHFKVREYFLPACLDVSSVPILPAPNASLVYSSDTDEMRCIVSESLSGWSSLSECLALIGSSIVSKDYWLKPIWFWSLHMLMMLLTMQNERFNLKQGVDMDMLLVSPDGRDLRLCSLAGGEFIRFGESDEDEDTLSQSMTKAFGYFLFDLLQRNFSAQDTDYVSTNNIQGDQHDNSDDVLCGMRNQLLHLLGSTKSSDESSICLTDFSSVSQILSLGNGTRDGEELEKLCQLALLALQPANTRPRLHSIWVFVGKPGLESPLESSILLEMRLKHLISIVEQQRLLQRLVRGLRVCTDECSEANQISVQWVIEVWNTCIERIFRFRELALNDDTKDETACKIFTQTLTQLLNHNVPHQLVSMTMRYFTQCSKSGDREQGQKSIQSLLKGFSDVLSQVETKTNSDELPQNALLMRTIQQILNCLISMASGQIPVRGMHEGIRSTTTRYHRDAATNAVLWRLTEPIFRDLLAIDMTSSKYDVLMKWTGSRRPPFGYISMFLIHYEAEFNALEASVHTLNLWWSDHEPLIPQHTPKSAAEKELVDNGFPVEPMTTHYIRCLYETKEIEFKLTIGVRVPKFRLATLQQFFGPTFFERRCCFPMVFVQPLVARVWSSIDFEQLICTLLRDGDEKIVFGALSLLECSTRVFRFDALRSPRIRVFKEHGFETSTAPSPQTYFVFSCVERAFALQLTSLSIVNEVKRVLDQTTRALKVLGESGTSSASRSQHTLVGILCVGVAWLINCLHGGEVSTQFWGITGIDHLIIGHCKANSLPFVKIKDSNMMNQVFQQGKRIAQQNTMMGSKWRVFTFGTTDSLDHGVGCASRNTSPFRLILEEIVAVGSNRAIGLMRTLLLSRTFREEVAFNDGFAVTCHNAAFQQDLISSSDYGKVSHAIDLARDITQLNGTVNEQIQLILYTKALFVHHAATAARLRVCVFAPVCREVWSWMEAAWYTIVHHPSPKGDSYDEKAVKLSRAQGDVVITGLKLLHSIITHPSVLIGDIVELTTLSSERDENPTTILNKLFFLISSLPQGLQKRRGCTLEVLIECAVAMLINAVRSRKYDEVALETVTISVDVPLMLELLVLDCGFEICERTTLLSIDTKQQLWSTLLFFDSRKITSQILDTNFLDVAVMAKLLSQDMNTCSTDSDVHILNQRLEAVLLLDILVSAASHQENSVNTQMLFADTCKLLLHHDIIAKEAQFVRKAPHSSHAILKHVAVSKRVMQLACCLCVDFSSQTPSRIFVELLENVGVPAWVVAFHQAQLGQHDKNNSLKLSTRVELFWKDWQGCGADATKSTNRTRVVEPIPKRKSEKAIRQAALHVRRSASQASGHFRAREKAQVEVDQMASSEVSDEDKPVKPLVSVSPVKLTKPMPEIPKPKWTAAGITESAEKSPSVVQTLLSIDAESALRLMKEKSTAPPKSRQKQPKSLTVDDALDSDAYSPFPAGSSSEEEAQRRADRKARRKRKQSQEKPSGDRESKESESKLERDSIASRQTRESDGRTSSSPSSSSVASRDRRHKKLQRPQAMRQTPKDCIQPAAPPRDQQLDALRAIFRKYDVDDDGAISFIDLRRAMDKQMTGQSHRLSDVEIQCWITEKDRSGQGVVSFEDFAAAFQAQLKR